MPDGRRQIADLDYEEALGALIERGASRPQAGELLDYLSAALELDRPDLFTSYAAWRAARNAREGDAAELEHALTSLRELAKQVGPSWRERWSRLAETALEASAGREPPHEDAAFEASPQRELAGRYLDALRACDRHGAIALALGAVEDGLSIHELYLEVFQPVLREVGRLWETRQLSVGQEHYCTAVTQGIMAQLYPRLSSDRHNGRCLVASSVEGNLHEVGPRMVADLLEVEGWSTHFLGADLPLDCVLEALELRGAHVLALSVTLASQLPAAARAIERVRGAAPLADTRIVVGGRAFGNDAELALAMGADAWASDAIRAVAAIDGLLAAPT